MSDSSQTLAPRPDRPVDPLTLMVIGAIRQAADRLGVPVFVVGAVARILLLENIHGLDAGRATTDVDFAFALDDWQPFRALKTFLLDDPRFGAAEPVAHRLFFRVPGARHPYRVDLIPFGGVESNRHTIAWPPDLTVLMNVTGFADAFAAAVCVEASPGFRIAVASLPGLAVLKLFAWADRRQDSPKDAFDLLALLRTYHEAGNEHRIYDDPGAQTVLEAVAYDPELAGAWLIGKDVATMASTATAAGLVALLTGATRVRLVEDMARAMKGRADAIDHARRLLEQFARGLTA